MEHAVKHLTPDAALEPASPEAVPGFGCRRLAGIACWSCCWIGFEADASAYWASFLCQTASITEVHQSLKGQASHPFGVCMHNLCASVKWPKPGSALPCQGEEQDGQLLLRRAADHYRFYGHGAPGPAYG